MFRVDQLPAQAGPIHLLLIAPSKYGKSTYVAEAAEAGFNVIYLDGDNGLSAIRNALTDKKTGQAMEGMSRIHYIAPNAFVNFVLQFLKSNTKRPLVWVPSLDKQWASTMDLPDSEPVFAYDVTKVPANFILTIDSWTTLSQDALQQMRPEQSAPLLDGTDQAVYGEAGAKVDYIRNMLQRLHCHVVVQAHPTIYEQYEKPLNTSGGDMKQKVMILREVLEVPISTSRVKGGDLGKAFNHIGWLDVTPQGTVDIDFRILPKKVSGGPPNRKARAKELNFLTVVQQGGSAVPTPPAPTDMDWCVATTHGELKAATGKR